VSSEDTSTEEPTEEEVTIWAPEPTGTDEIMTLAVDKWITKATHADDW